MAIYPYNFSSDSSLIPKVITKKKRGVDKMACKTTKKKSTTKPAAKSSAKKSSCKKKPCC